MKGISGMATAGKILPMKQALKVGDHVEWEVRQEQPLIPLWQGPQNSNTIWVKFYE